MKKETAIDQAVQCLRSGGTALLPTDSLWSICCDPKNAEALKKITQLKTALHKNDFTLLVPNERLMYQCVREVPDIAWDMIEITSSPLSLILESNAYLPKEIHCEDKKVIVRFIKEGSMHHILHQMNRPLLSMPALTPEGKPASTFQAIDGPLKNSMDFVFPPRMASKMSGQPSKLLEIAIDGRVKIVRK